MPSELQITLGAMEIGVVIGAILLGINILQVFQYFRDYPNDSRKLRALVGLILTLDLLHTTLLIQSLYHYTVSGFGDAGEFTYSTISWNITPVLTGVITFIVQSFFSYRVYLVTKSAVMAIFCGLIAIVRFGFSLEACEQSFAYHNFVEYGANLHWPIIASTSLGALGDVVNAATLCISLYRNRSGVKRTDKVVDKLIAYAMGTGLITSMVSVSELICYLTMRNFIWLAQLSITAKLFSNSLLASLNARRRLREELEGDISGSAFTFSIRSPVRIEMNSATTGDDQSIPKRNGTKIGV